MWDRYFTTATLDDALALLHEHQGTARLIAGGTDILIELERGQRDGITALIDISRLTTLATITKNAGGTIHLGPLVTHNHVVDSALLQAYALPLVQACWEVGAPQIRNRATVAGNLVTGSPANDTITPLMALGASVTLRTRDSKRVVPLSEFYTGLRHSVMQDNEMITDIAFPAMRDNQRGMFIKLGLRAAQAISVVNTAVIVTMDDDTVTDARITLGSVAPTIIRVSEAEQILVGQSLAADVIAQAAQAAATTPTPIDDVRSTAEYRTEMIRVIVTRALRTLAENAQQVTWAQPAAMLWGDQNPTTTNTQHDTQHPITTTINGHQVTVNSGQSKTLLRFLREDAGLPGTKEGCAEGECGACTVFLDGAAVMACMVPAPRAHNADIVTVEGLQDADELHPIQQSFIQEGAVQCGYCTPGFLMSGAKLLEEHPQPTEAQALQSISGNLCRCTGYYKIVQAIMNASQAVEE